MPDEWYDGPDDGSDFDDMDDEMYDCHGYFDSQRADAKFYCGAAGSEDCDECPMNCWIGLTNRQIDALEAELDDDE